MIFTRDSVSVTVHCGVAWFISRSRDTPSKQHVCLGDICKTASNGRHNGRSASAVEKQFTERCSTVQALENSYNTSLNKIHHYMICLKGGCRDEEQKGGKDYDTRCLNWWRINVMHRDGTHNQTAKTCHKPDGKTTEYITHRLQRVVSVITLMLCLKTKLGLVRLVRLRSTCSSLNIIIWSKRKTRRSWNCSLSALAWLLVSATSKLSCCSSRPCAVILPWTIHRQQTLWSLSMLTADSISQNHYVTLPDREIQTKLLTGSVTVSIRKEINTS